MNIIITCGLVALGIHFLVNRIIDFIDYFKMKNQKKLIEKAKELGELWVTLKDERVKKGDIEFFWKIELNTKNGVCVSYKNRYDDEENIEYMMELMLLSNEDAKPYINFREEGSQKNKVRLGVPVWNTKIMAGYNRLLEEVQNVKERYTEEIDIKEIMSKVDRIEFHEK